MPSIATRLVDKINETHKNFIINQILSYSLLFRFFSILSKHVEHNKCPFLIQNVLVDLSISFLQIKHLKIGDISNQILYE